VRCCSFPIAFRSSDFSCAVVGQVFLASTPHASHPCLVRGDAHLCQTTSPAPSKQIAPIRRACLLGSAARWFPIVFVVSPTYTVVCPTQSGHPRGVCVCVCVCVHERLECPFLSLAHTVAPLPRFACTIPIARISTTSRSTQHTIVCSMLRVSRWMGDDTSIFLPYDSAVGQQQEATSGC
jgi:hypothetical protein